MNRKFAAGMVCLFAGLAGILLFKHLTTPPAPHVIPPLHCSAAVARYQHQADPRFTAHFIRPPHAASSASPYLLRIKSASQQSYWFRFAASNGYGGLFLVPVHAPRADADGMEDIYPDSSAEDVLAPYRDQLRFYPLDEALGILESPPLDAPDDKAPAFLLMPELGNLLWYEPALLNGQPGSTPEPLPRGLFRLSSCSGS